MSINALIRLTSSQRRCNWEFEPSNPKLVLRCDSAAGATLSDPSSAQMRWDHPLAALDWLDEKLRNGAFTAGSRWVGYLGYDLVRLFENLPALAGDPLDVPLFVFTLHDPEPSHHRASEAPWRVRLRPNRISDRGRDRARPSTGSRPATIIEQNLQSTFTRAVYESAVARAIDYIRAGDIFQVNLSQRFSCGLPAQPANIYQRLQTQSPALYGACLCYDDFALLSNSPELFLRITPNPDQSRTITTRPIKGTRPRLSGMEEELHNSIKDQAELNMIVDVERNDLGRICEIGTVRVTEPRTIETHPTVYHGVATIQGQLRPDISLVDILRATFPTGSVTGAPKIRAMEIIDELEPVRRGPYCGAIGYLAADGTIEFNVAIRTMIIKDGLVHIPVGGGIVADSDPAAEYEETLVKARAMFSALGIAAEHIRS